MFISNKNLTNYFDKNNKPAAFANPGDSVTFETLDCYNNNLLPEGNTFANVDRRFGNPATGPLFVNGAEPGDTLKVTVEKLEVGPVGILDVGPGSGALSGIFPEPIIHRIRVEDGKICYKDILIDAKPMIGEIGTAPAGEPVHNISVGDFGGNLDCTKICEGAVVYLPVFVPGALLATGDFHAIMGDGEIANCGLEIEGKTTLKVDVLKDTGIDFVMVENDKEWITIGCANTVDEACVCASKHMFRFLTEKQGLTQENAAMLMDMMLDLVVCQIVNPNKTVRAEVPKDMIEKFKELK